MATFADFIEELAGLVTEKRFEEMEMQRVGWWVSDEDKRDDRWKRIQVLKKEIDRKIESLTGQSARIRR